jgi:hypothetical protein
MLFSYVGSLILYGLFQLNYQGIVNKIVQHFQVLFSCGLPAKQFNLGDG